MEKMERFYSFFLSRTPHETIFLYIIHKLPLSPGHTVVVRIAGEYHSTKAYIGFKNLWVLKTKPAINIPCEFYDFT
jgi:hypothetical protein